MYVSMDVYTTMLNPKSSPSFDFLLNPRVRRIGKPSKWLPLLDNWKFRTGGRSVLFRGEDEWARRNLRRREEQSDDPLASGSKQGLKSLRL